MASSRSTHRKARVVKVVDNRPLANAIGANVRRLRTAANLTQRRRNHEPETDP